MTRSSLRPYYIMSSLVAAALAVTASAGLLNTAIYSPFVKSPALLVGLPIQDLASLLAAPLLVAAMVLTGRGSRRALVLWAGLLLFAGYYYAFYVFGYVYTIFYPLYIAILSLSFYALIGLLLAVDLPAFARHVDGSMPVRFIAFVLAMPLLLLPIWGMGILQGIQTQQVGPADLVFVLDLAFLIPLMTYAAVQIWRRQPVGYLLGGTGLVKAALSGILLTGGSVRQILSGYAVGPDFGMYIFLMVAGAAGFILYMRHLHDTPIDAQDMQVSAGMRPSMSR